MGNILAIRDEYRAQIWAMLLQECRESWMTNKDFCERRGVSEKSFYYWQRKLRQQIVETASPQLVQLDPTPETGDMLQIQYRGAELRLPGGVDLEAVAVCSVRFSHYDRSDKSPKLLCGLRLHRSAVRNRRTGCDCDAAVWRTSGRRESVPFL